MVEGWPGRYLLRDLFLSDLARISGFLHRKERDDTMVLFQVTAADPQRIFIL